MAMKMRPGGSDRQGRFGKRGPVTLSPSSPADAQADGNSNMKWIGGGLAAVAIMALVSGGTGGGSLLGGLIGGLLGHQLSKGTAGAQGRATTATPAPATATAPSSTTVQRGGFGTTASSVGAGSHVGG